MNERSPVSCGAPVLFFGTMERLKDRLIQNGEGTPKTGTRKGLIEQIRKHFSFPFTPFVSRLKKKKRERDTRNLARSHERIIKLFKGNETKVFFPFFRLVVLKRRRSAEPRSDNRAISNSSRLKEAPRNQVWSAPLRFLHRCRLVANDGPRATKDPNPRKSELLSFG